MDSLEQKRKQAIEYLRNRKIYVLEHSFVPTNSALTDVQRTIDRYRQQTEGITLRQVQKVYKK